MNKLLRQRFFIGLMLATALFSLVPTPVFAAGETTYLTPASGATQTNKTFTVSVDGYVGQTWWWWWVPVGATSVQGSINYPANLLRVISISNDGSSFPNGTATPNNTTGRIDFNKNSSSQHTNKNVHLFTITFQAVAPGSASVTFGSTQYNIGSASTTGGTYTISTPPPPPSPSPTPQPSTSPRPSTSPKSSPVPTPSVTPTPEETPAPVTESDGGLQIQNVKITTNRQENKITWTINNATAIPEFTYGTAKNSLKSDGTVTKKPDGSYEVILPDLKPGTLYYFLVKAATPDNLQGANYSGILTTRGYPVQLTVQQNNLLIPGAKVKIHERTFVTNKNAIITTELSDGKHTATITPPNSSESYDATFTVVKKKILENGNPELQSFILNITAVGVSPGGGTSAILPLIGGAVALLATLGALISGFIFFKRRKQTEQDSAVDSDLLAATYGNAINNYRSNTPEPNLGISQAAIPPQQNSAPPQDVSNVQNGSAVGVGALANTVALPADAPNPPAPQPLEPQPPASSPTAFESPLPVDSNAMPEPTQTSIDPTALPLPPPPIQPIVNEQPTSPPGYSEEEQLSSDVTSIEAGQDSSPSAIYDPETGDLAIVHHHNTPVTPVTESALPPPAPEPLPSTDLPESVSTALPEQQSNTAPTVAEPSDPAIPPTAPQSSLAPPTLTAGGTT